MNIAYVCADFGVPFFGTSGASVHLREMVAAFREAGHAVSVLSPVIEGGSGSPVSEQERARFDPPTLRPGGTSARGAVRLIPVPPDPRHVQVLEDLERVEGLLGRETRTRQELRNLLYNVPLHHRLREALVRAPVDFVYERYTLFSLAGVRLAHALRVPHVLEVNAPLAEEQERTRGLEMRELARETEGRIFRASDAVLVVSRRLGEFVASCGVPWTRMHVVPNGVDPRRFAGASGPPGLDPSVHARLRGRCVVGFVGTLKPWHGTETLLQAFRALRSSMPNLHLLVVGDGPGRAQLESCVRADGLGDCVTFTGAVPHDEVPRFLAAMDIATAPYTPNPSFYFSPIKLFEYMAMGKPVVAGRIGQIEELVRDGETALLYEPGDVAGLAATLVRLVSDAELRRRIGEAARAWVETERTWRANAERVVAIARELTATRTHYRARAEIA